jgi:hypothetical protein
LPQWQTQPAESLNIGQHQTALAPPMPVPQGVLGRSPDRLRDRLVTRDKHFVRTISSGKSASVPGNVEGHRRLPHPGHRNRRPGVQRRRARHHHRRPAALERVHPEHRRGQEPLRLPLDLLATSAACSWARTGTRTSCRSACSPPAPAATVTGAFGGTSLTSATTLYKTSATDLVAGLTLRRRPGREGRARRPARFAYLRPAQYYLLAGTPNTLLTHVDYNGGDNG